MDVVNDLVMSKISFNLQEVCLDQDIDSEMDSQYSKNHSAINETSQMSKAEHRAQASEKSFQPNTYMTWNIQDVEKTQKLKHQSLTLI